MAKKKPVIKEKKLAPKKLKMTKDEKTLLDYCEKNGIAIEASIQVHHTNPMISQAVMVISQAIGVQFKVINKVVKVKKSNKK